MIFQTSRVLSVGLLLLASCVNTKKPTELTHKIELTEYIGSRWLGRSALYAQLHQ